MRYFLILLLVVIGTADISAQTTPTATPTPTPTTITNNCTEFGGTSVPILQPGTRKFKIKAIVGVSSKTAREADYVEFQTMEKIYSAGNPPKLLFDTGTSIYGAVTLRKSRHFPMRRGKIEVKLDPLINWNGDRIEIAISRHGPFPINDRPKQRNDPCEPKDPRVAKPNCVAGRGNAEVGILVPAVAAAASGVVTAVADDEDTEFIAATAFFSIAKELGNLLNGTDVEISKDEIFDLTFDAKQQTVCAMFSKDDAKEKAAVAGPAKLEIPIAGEIDRRSGTVSITHGEFRGQTFAGIVPLVVALKKAKYRSDSVDQLRVVLEESIAALEKAQHAEAGRPSEPFTGQSWQMRMDDIKSLVVVEIANENKLQFKAFVGTQTELTAIVDPTKCRELNDKCVICPDGKIYCTITAIKKE
jgi:hypothetical protein